MDLYKRTLAQVLLNLTVVAHRQGLTLGQLAAITLKDDADEQDS